MRSDADPLMREGKGRGFSVGPSAAASLRVLCFFLLVCHSTRPFGCFLPWFRFLALRLALRASLGTSSLVLVLGLAATTTIYLSSSVFLCVSVVGKAGFFYVA